MRDEPVRPTPVDWPGRAPGAPEALREGLAAPVQVAFCAMVLPAPHASAPHSEILDLGARFASLEYVLTEVRLKGNAYGAGCHYSESPRTFTFQSYRDPRIVQTLQAFEGLRDYVGKVAWTQTDIDRAIISTAKHSQRPIRPAEATDTALWHYIRGYTRERLEELYEQVLAATPAAVKRALLDELESGLPNAAVCVLSSRSKLEEANAQLPGREMAIEELIKS
jgi:presequence protease